MAKSKRLRRDRTIKTFRVRHNKHRKWCVDTVYIDGSTSPFAWGLDTKEAAVQTAYNARIAHDVNKKSP